MVIETLKDTVTNGTLTRVYRNVDLSGLVGSNTALVGFTGSDGGLSANQTVTNFTFTTGSAPAAPTPTFTPIAATGYNQNMIVSAASGATLVTATMDGGTAKTGTTWYEKGVSSANPATGLPAAGEVFGSGNDADHVFTLQSYAASNAVMMDASNLTGHLTLTSPAAYKALSLLVTGANGGASFNVIVHFGNGAPDEIHAAVPSPNWFNSSPGIALVANGRETLAGSVNVSSSNPRLYQEDITLGDQTDPVAGMDFTWNGTGSARTAIFGISGAAVPEPVNAICLAGLGGLAIMRRRRS